MREHWWSVLAESSLVCCTSLPAYYFLLNLVHSPSWLLARVGEVEASLVTALELMEKSAKSGPLKSLLLAKWIREEFLRANRDLCNAFSIMCQGALLVSFCMQ
jgi:hypothetical protein